jgi:hypothetical protein
MGGKNMPNLRFDKEITQTTSGGTLFTKSPLTRIRGCYRLDLSGMSCLQNDAGIQ